MQNITKKIMEQYEMIRKLGPCNMFAFDCVHFIADQLELYALASLEKEEYVYILEHFGELMKKFDIKQT